MTYLASIHDSSSLSTGDLKDHQWKRLQPLLPPPKPEIGRPYTDHRRVINGILWILRTVAPWRDLLTNDIGWSC